MKQSLISGCAKEIRKDKATPLVINRSLGLKGKISLPGDKSIAHRATIISSLSEGRTKISNFPFNQDCLSTIEVFRKLGIKIIQDKSSVVVYGKGLRGLRKPRKDIFINESGTTFRLLLGVLAGQDFKVRLKSGRLLSQRPMSRVTVPLRLMGAHIKASRITHHASPEEYSPIIIHGNPILRG